MCGIAGYRTDRAVPPGVLEDMVERLRHRGPDSAGFHHDEGYAAGMRRLSINDLPGGDQPLRSEDGRIVLFYNGEIYNSPGLRRELEARGHVFATRCDGEVICHLFEERGEDAFGLLDGMFAVALWVSDERKIILARDIPGEKPLYYAPLPGGGLAFASEIKSLTRCPGVDLALDVQALWDFPTFLWVPEPETVYRGIKALPRGCLLALDGEGMRIRRYPHVFGRADRLNREDLADEIRRVVTEAVRSRLLSDVPVGSFLSGGLDSSIVAAVASREVDGLTTFTVGFENLTDPYHGMADESAQARAFADSLGVRNVCIRVTAEDFRRNLMDFCAFGDQPFSVSSGLGVLAVAKEAKRRGIKVLLTGDGADEMFGGYSWYACLEEALKLRPPWDGSSGISFQDMGLPKRERVAAIGAYPFPLMAWAWHYYASERDKALLFHSDLRDATQSSLRFFESFKPDGDWEALDFIRHDREFYFPNEMLRKADRMTMAHSVEGRVPFAAPSVLALAALLRTGDMIGNGRLKDSLRRAFADLLPLEVIGRPKHGFNVPLDHWLNDEWSGLTGAAFAPDSALARHGLIRPDSGESASKLLRNPTRLCGHTVFSFIMLNLWLENEYGNHS